MDRKAIVAELERELKMRQQVYPGLIRSGKLHPDLAANRNKALQEAIAIVKADDKPTVKQEELF